MAALLPVLVTDNFDTERQKINDIVDQVNNIGTADNVWEFSEPINDGDILTYNANETAFVNTGIAALVDAVLTRYASTASGQNKAYFMAQSSVVF